MRVRRTPYIMAFLLAGALAAGAYALGQPRSEIVRATVDIPVLTQISGEMVEVVRVSPAGAPPNAAASLDEVLGRYAALPILAGQDVDRRALELTPGERALGFGAPLGPGQVAFALPVEPEQALGGALAPGARVDVVAVPNALRTQPSIGSGEDGPGGTLLGRSYLVLALRTGDGQPLVQSAGPEGSGTGALIVPRLGSVVIAIPAERLEEFASAALTSTFYLALARPEPEAGP